MNGPIAQLVALACHANAALQGQPVPEFFPANSTCAFCDYIRFSKVKRRWLGKSFKEIPLAPNPNVWFDQLKGAGSRSVLARHFPENRSGFSDRMTAGFVGGGGRWLLETKSPKASDYYECRQVVWNQNAPEQRIWRVTYGRIAEREPSQPESKDDLRAIKLETASALSEIEDFARQNDLGGFADMFRKAMDCLESEQPFELVYHKDLAPAGMLELTEKQLLAAAQAAWVFGGMGSWNDLGFDGTAQQTYEAVSDRLFNVLNRAICAATNSTAASSTH